MKKIIGRYLLKMFFQIKNDNFEQSDGAKICKRGTFFGFFTIHSVTNSKFQKNEGDTLVQSKNFRNKVS